jgi:hypothetical protein
MVEVESLPSAFIFSPSRSTINEGISTTTGATVPLELQIPQHLLQPLQVFREFLQFPVDGTSGPVVLQEFQTGLPQHLLTTAAGAAPVISVIVYSYSQAALIGGSTRGISSLIYP